VSLFLPSPSRALSESLLRTGIFAAYVRRQQSEATVVRALYVLFGALTFCQRHFRAPRRSFPSDAFLKGRSLGPTTMYTKTQTGPRSNKHKAAESRASGAKRNEAAQRVEPFRNNKCAMMKMLLAVVLFWCLIAHGDSAERKLGLATIVGYQPTHDVRDYVSFKATFFVLCCRKANTVACLNRLKLIKI